MPEKTFLSFRLIVYNITVTAYPSTLLTPTPPPPQKKVGELKVCRRVEKRNLRLLKKSCFLRYEKTSQNAQYFACIFLIPFYKYMYECNFFVSLVAGTY
jgi:hypothetical protein